MSLPSIGANNVNPLLLKAQTTKTPSAGTETVIVLPEANMPDNRYSFGTYKHNVNGEVRVYYITFVSEGGEWLPLWIQDEATGKKEHF